MTASLPSYWSEVSQNERLAGLDDPGGKTFAQRLGGDGLALPDAVLKVREADQVGLGVVKNDKNVVQIRSADRREDPGDLVADQVNDGLEFKLPGQPLPNPVDDLQFVVALLGLLQQTLGLVE